MSEATHEVDLRRGGIGSHIVRDQIIDATHIPSFGPLYAIAPYPKRINFASQQRRAFNLIWALTDAQRIRRGSSVAVIGAGVAGLTAASALIRQGIDVQVFEASNETLKIQRYTTSRFIHPTLNYWPSVALDPTADFPCLYWSADTCSIVISTIRAQWEIEFGNEIVNFNSRVNQLISSEDAISLHLHGGRITPQFDSVILAVGFGLERPPAYAYLPSYWDNEDPRSNENTKQIYVSGIGDGGLLEALRLVYEGFGEGQLTSRLAHIARRLNLETEIRAIEIEAALKADSNPEAASAFLARKYQMLLSAGELDILFDELLKGGRSVKLVSRGPHAFTLGSAPIHRLMLAKAIQSQRIEVVANAEISTDKKGIVTVGGVPLFSSDAAVIVRHGPEGEIGKLLDKKFLDPLEARQSILSQYQHQNLWPTDYFDAVSDASNRVEQQTSLEVRLENVLASLVKEFRGALFEVAQVNGALCYRARLSSRSRLIAEDFPETILGVPLVVVNEPWKALSHNSTGNPGLMKNLKPLEAGDKINAMTSLGDRITGTIGGFVRAAGDGAIYAVAARHCVGTAGTLIYAAGDQSTLNPIGRVSDRLGTGTDDLALIELDNDIRFQISPDAPTEIETRTALIGRTVTTRSIDGSALEGRVVGVAWNVPVAGNLGSAVLCRAFIVRSLSEMPFAGPGDSGALVVSDNGSALGIVVAGTESEILVLPLKGGLDALGAEFVKPGSLVFKPYERVRSFSSSALADTGESTKTHLWPKITVIGVGGAGGNAIDNMIVEKLTGVEFITANTDAQALAMAKAGRRVQLGPQVTEGLGAGSLPEIGRAAAEESIDEIMDNLEGSQMCFVTAGMGGGTGTGAAPVIARAARSAGILTVGVVTKPFAFEGGRRMRTADAGIEELRLAADTVIVISNQNLLRIADEKMTFADAFATADKMLLAGVSCITDLIVKEGLINLDFVDVKSVIKGMGRAIMGIGAASGDGRALKAAEAAIANLLLDDISMKGAKSLLISISGGSDLTLSEVDEVASRIRGEVWEDADIVIGAIFDRNLDGKFRVSVVATGLDGGDADVRLKAISNGQSARRILQ